MELEEQRYGRNKDTTINKSYIEGGEYRRKFDHITVNNNTNRLLYAVAKKILYHRSGTLYEDMFWIDPIRSTIVTSVLNSDKESLIRYNNSVFESIKNRHDLITIHNHPQSMPPSPKDFYCNYIFNYATSLVVCHDGKVYEYSADEEINPGLFELYAQQYFDVIQDSLNAQLYAIEEIKEKRKVKFREVLP